MVEGIVFGILGQFESLRSLEKPFPGANVSTLVQSFGTVRIRNLRQSTSGPLVSADQAAAVVAFYAVAFAAIAAVLLRRRDIP